MGVLPNINLDFRKETNSEFFQEVCHELGYKTSEYQNSDFIPQHIDLSFLKMFSFNLRSEVQYYVDVQQPKLQLNNGNPSSSSSCKGMFCVMTYKKYTIHDQFAALGTW